jgi:hypothetical protein
MNVVSRIMNMVERLANLIFRACKVAFYMIFGALVYNYTQTHPQQVSEFKAEAIPVLNRMIDAQSNFISDAQANLLALFTFRNLLFFAVLLTALIIFIRWSNQRHQMKNAPYGNPTGSVRLPEQRH